MRQQLMHHLICSLIRTLLLVPTGFVLLLGVAAHGQLGAQPPEGTVESVEAVVHAPEFSGACWLLTSKFGRLEPTNLAPEFKVNGLKVIISFSKRHDLASTCGMGWIVTLSSIAREAT
jgi:hypothetical protein